ncbi:MAG: ATP-binding protein [Bacteroidota bacterium]
MKTKPPKKVTIKIVLGYLSMAFLVLALGVFIRAELKSYLSIDNSTNQDKLLLATNELLTAIYEAEHLSKMALNRRVYGGLKRYAAKVDTLTKQIDTLKPLVSTAQQRKMFDSIQVLLSKKFENTQRLRQLQLQNDTPSAIDSLQLAFNNVELSMGRIVPEQLVPNFNELSVTTQKTIKEYTSLLNQNIPDNSTVQTANQKIDSALVALRDILQHAKARQLEKRRSLLQRELRIARTDLEISQQLQQLVSAIEQEIYKDTRALNEHRRAVLKRTAKWLGVLGLSSLCVVILFTFLISRDFWKVQQYRKRLELEKGYSESLLKSREQLITTVSHDLRTPLNTIMGYTELCLQTTTGTALKQHLGNIRTASAYVASLVNDLLDFTKLEAGQVKINKKPFVLTELIRLTASEHQKKYHNKPIDLLLDVHHDLDTPILQDPLRVKQVLHNLIGNAFKFTKKGFVKIYARPCFENKKQPLLKIEVHDSGIGIKKEEQERIFQEFVQSDEKVAKKHSGYGLGLAISRRLALLLNGNLYVDSEKGLGSCFTLILPLQFTQENTAIRKRPINHHLSGITLLIIDDDPAYLDLLTKSCSLRGITVIALQDFETLHPDKVYTYDAILTDIQMPISDGFQVLKALQQGNYSHYTHQPVIAMTGQPNISLTEYRELGFSSVLRKPFSIEELMDVLKKQLAGSPNFSTNSNAQVLSKKPNDSCLFDLSAFCAFLGYEKDEVDQVLKAFIKETKINIAQIDSYIASEAIDRISFTAHRMLPMFYHLKAMRVIPILEELEHLDQSITIKAICAKKELLEEEFKRIEKELLKAVS